MAEDPLEFPQLLPPLGNELLVDEALGAVSAQIPDTPDLTTTATADSDEPVVYGKAWAWNFARGRFVRNGQAPVPVWDFDNLKVYVQVVMNVEQGAHPIYEDDIGMEPDSNPVGELIDDPAVQQRYMEAVADAIMVHDRVTQVTNFDFYADPNDPDAPLANNLYVYFEILTDSGEIVPVTTLVSPDNA